MYSQEKVIVTMNQLAHLLRSCTNCGCDTVFAAKRREGAYVEFDVRCTACTHEYSWGTSPKIGRSFAVNNLICGAILFTGSSPSRFLRVMRTLNIAVPAYDTFMAHQSSYLHGVSIINMYMHYSTNMAIVCYLHIYVISGICTACLP